HLRSALEAFIDLGAQPLVARAGQELRASGETARKRDPSTLLQLTPMEAKIAQLVSTGLSNKDVAAQCWVSPRTVAFHLRNVFAKVGVSSRGELAQLGFSCPVPRLSSANPAQRSRSQARRNPGAGNPGHLTGARPWRDDDGGYT